MGSLMFEHMIQMGETVSPTHTITAQHSRRTIQFPLAVFSRDPKKCGYSELLSNSQNPFPDLEERESNSLGVNSNVQA